MMNFVSKLEGVVFELEKAISNGYDAVYFLNQIKD